MPKEQETFELTLREIHKIAEAGGRGYYHLLHIVMMQSKFGKHNSDSFQSWAEKVIKRELKPSQTNK